MLLFVSDLHLEASRPQVAQAFFQFLDNEASQAEALYILGDLFEVWVGDDDDDPLILDVQANLKQLSDSGTSVYFMHGNRDFLIGDRFAQSTGCTLLQDPTTIIVDGVTVVLMHGDLLCTEDHAYQAFRKESRGAAWINNVMAKSLNERRAIGAQLRQQSKSMSSRKADDIMDVNDHAVADIFFTHKAQKLIHGHTHRPKRHPIDVGSESVERIVLGDWDQQAWCLYYCDDWQLKSWSIPPADPLPVK